MPIYTANLGAANNTNQPLSGRWLYTPQGGSEGDVGDAATSLNQVGPGSLRVRALATGLGGSTFAYSTAVAVPAVGGSGTGGVAISTIVSRNATTRATTFTFTRTGDTSGPKTQPWQVQPTSLSGRTPATIADFGGAFPSGSVSWAAGETATKTITVTPTSNALPE